jgi:hypothetical protein
MGVPLRYLEQHFQAVGIAEMEVEQKHRRNLLFDLFKQTLLVGHSDDSVVPGAQQVLQESENVWIVVGDHHERS